MNYAEILKIKSHRQDVFLGYDDNNNNFMINLNDNPNILITGSTGTSKSIMFNEILLQLVNKNIEENLQIISFSATNVELKFYHDTDYNYFKKKDYTLIDAYEVVKERIKKLKELKCKNYKDLELDTLPYIIIAIDEAGFILEDKANLKIIKKLIKKCHNIGISIIMNTNNIYNDFFTKNINLLMDCRISFDFVSKMDAKQNNIEDCQNLSKNEFLMELGSQKRPHKYYVYEYDENTFVYK